MLVLPLLLSSCHKAIWDKLDDHEKRIARLEALCNQFNTTIQSLQQLVAALQANDFIKEVVPVMEDGETIGYTITFVHSAPITIYHGHDGKDGEDGHTPVVGIRQDSEDGKWYWTLDGEWMLDEEGAKYPSQATAPRLKVSGGYWWVSYDDGQTWEQLDKAINDGPYDPMFDDVYQDEKNVYFVLSNGQTITIQKSHGLTWVYV